MPTVLPLMIPNIAWEKYIQAVSEHSGSSPTTNVDNSTIKIADFTKYIVQLDELQNGSGTNALDTLRNETGPLNHLFFSFLIISSKASIFKIMETTDLSILSRSQSKGEAKSRISVISGALLQWRNALVSRQKSKEVRLILNQCLSFFSKFGLANIFDNYRKHALSDETFLLEYKND